MEELDQSEEKISEHSISSRINKVSGDDQSSEAIAERLAFAFCENHPDRPNGSGTYFGPMMVWVGDDGKTYENPSIALVTKEILEYWKSRSQSTNNPLLKSRYSGLVWDLSEAAIGEKADYKIAVEYVSALTDATDRDYCEHSHETIAKITRAYKVASSINNKDLIIRCIESAISLEDRIAMDDTAGRWGFCFNLFVLGKCKDLSQTHEQKLLKDLESRLERVSKDQSPWVCESAGIPLAKYYRSKGMIADVGRVIQVVGTCFENACVGLTPMQASSWLQHVHDVYISFNMKGDAERAARKISEVGPNVVDSMQTFSHRMEISKEKLDAYLDSMTSGGLEKTLGRIAVHFIPKKDQVEQQVLELAKNNPVSYLFSKILQDHKGRPVATIGSIEDDIEGNIIHQLSQNMSIDSFFLMHSLNKASVLYALTAKELTDFIFLSPIFEETKKDLVHMGLQTYLNKDYVSAIHILVPQAEAAIRTLVELMGGATLRTNKQGGLQLRTLNDLLGDDTVKNCFGIDSSFYFRMLLTDQRGWNLRNDVCHGISPSGAFNYLTADRIMHVILCLSQARASNI